MPPYKISSILNQPSVPTRRRQRAAWLAVLGCLALAALSGGCSPELEQPLPATAAPTTVPTPLPPASPTSRPVDPATPFPAIQVPVESLDGLEIAFWHPWLGLAGEFIEAQAAAFNAQNPYGITLRALAVENLEAAVRSALDAGGAPDLAVGFNYHALAWDRSGASVADLAPYFYDPRFGFDPAGRADFFPAFLQADTLGGKQLALPLYRTAEVLLYNRSWAEELGFAAAPQDLEALQEQACAAAASLRADEDLSNDGQGGLILAYEPGAVLSWIHAFGGGISPLEGGGAYGLDRPETAEAFAFVRGLLDEDCAWAPEERFPNQAFAERRGLFLQASLAGLPFQQAAMESAANPDSWQMIAYPNVNGRPVSLASGPGFVIFSGSPEAQLAAWLFVRWFMEPSRLAGWVEASGYFPARASVLDVLDAGLLPPAWGAAAAILASADPLPAVKSWSQVRWVLEDSARVLYAPLTTLEDIPAIVSETDLLAEELAGFFR